MNQACRGQEACIDTINKEGYPKSFFQRFNFDNFPI